MRNKKNKSNNEKIKKVEYIDPPNLRIINSIDCINVWTPEKEDDWLKELGKMSPKEIYMRFPPMKKPKNVSLRGKSHG